MEEETNEHGPIDHVRGMLGLVRKFCSVSHWSVFSGSDLHDMTFALQPPAAIAKWIRAFKPDLARKKRLAIVVAGAGARDSIDDGCWYRTLPWMLGNEDGVVDISLVGPGLYTDKIREALPFECLPGRTLCSVAGRLNRVFAPAEERANVRIGEYLRKRTRPIDLVVMFNPGLEDEPWFESDQLAAITSLGVPVAIASYSEQEALTEQWLLDRHGYTAFSPLVKNTMCPEDTAAGGWAQQLWSLSGGVGARSRMDALDEAAFTAYKKAASLFISLTGQPVQLDCGRRISGPRGERAVVLPARGLAVSTDTGLVFATEKSPALPEYVGRQMTPLELMSFPDEPGLAFGHISWAVVAFAGLIGGVQQERLDMGEVLQLAKLIAEERMANAAPGTEEAEDDRLFPFSKEELNVSMRNFLRDALGQDVQDPEAFLEGIRAQGGLHGPTHHAWWDVLSNLGWSLEGYTDVVSRFDVAFTARSRDGTCLPIVCERYAYTPGDDEDGLTNEAKRELARRHPGGVILVFKAAPYKEVKGSKYTFGGLFYFREQWRPFALGGHLNGLDSLLSQRDSGFSFNNPTAQYADREGEWSIALNMLTHGSDPNKQQRALRLRQGEWVSVLPAVL